METNRGPLLRYGLAALAGILVSLSFAPVNLAGAAWIGPGLMLFSAMGQTPKRAFGLGFTAGAAFFLCSLYWLLAMPYTWYDIPLAPALGWIALSAYSALYTGVWVWFGWSVFPGEKPQTIDDFLATPTWKRIGWGMLCAAGWVALELVRGRFLGGFPWNYLGTSQHRMLPLIQIASITGVFGVSFLMVWFSIALGGAIFSLMRRPSTGTVWTEMALPMLVLAGVAAFGMSQIMEKPSATRTLTAAMIQPSFRQTLIWDPQEDAKRFREVLHMSEQALANKPDLLIWPESAVPDLSPEQQQEVGAMLARAKVWLLFCDDSAEITPAGETNYYNSSFLVSPDRGVEAIYHKRRLVIFGEYIPLVRWLPFLRWLAPIGPGFTPGERLGSFVIRQPPARLSPLICFEDSFPEEARAHAALGPDFLVNLTNDGWFGEGGEQWQQAASAIFRCIENGIPMLRCCNNGVTCQIDRVGRIQVLRDAKGRIYGPGSMLAEVPLQGEAKRTFYNLHGDLFGWACGVVSLGMVALRRGRHLIETVSKN